MNRVWFRQAKPSKPGHRPGSTNGGEYVVGWRGKITRDVGFYPGIDEYDVILKKCNALDRDDSSREHYPKAYDSL